MAERRADVFIRYVTQLVDRGSKALLKDDRAVRREIAQTDKAMRQHGQTATRTGRQIAAGSHAARRAKQSEARAAREVTAGSNATAAAAAKEAAAYRRATAAALAHVKAQRAQAATARRAAAASATFATVGTAGANVGVRGRGAATAATAAAGISAGAGLAAFVGFEKQMDRVQAVANATGAQIAAMTEQAKQLGEDTAFSAGQAADGMYQLATAGFTANETMKIIPGTLALASASGVELAEAAELQASAIRGFGLNAGDATRVADTLAKTVNSSAIEMADLGATLPFVASTARQTGTSFEEVAAAAAILGNAGIKGSQSGTALRTSMLRLTDPSKKMLGIFDKLGIGADELAAVPLPKVIGRIAGAIKGLPRGEQVGVISAIFGKEAAPSILNLMAQGEAGINRVVKELENADGTAKRSASTMRDNVAGAWDEFTGSVETAAINLTERFGPAIKNALKDAAQLVNVGARATGDFFTGLGGADPGKRIQRGPGGRVESVELEESKAQKVGSKVREIVQNIARDVQGVGQRIVEALKPAEPFLRNILLPLLEGLGKGILASVVGAFNVAVPAIRIFATVLGAVGKVAAPLKPVFQGIGTVLGFLFGGPILKGVALLGKLGGVFRILAVPIRVAGSALSVFGRAASAVVRVATPLAGLIGKALAGAVSRAVSVFGRIGGRLAGVAKSAVGAVGKAIGPIVARVTGPVGRTVSAAAKAASGLAGGLAGAARRGVSAAAKALGGLVGRFAGIASRAVSAVVKGLGKIAGRIPSVAGSVLSAFGDLGRDIVNAIVNAIKSAPGKVLDAVKGIVPGPLRKIIPGLRRGGSVRGFAGGGGVPGDPRRDGTLALLAGDEFVLTGDGQRMVEDMAGPGSLALIEQSQMPHFQKGGKVSPRGLGGLAAGAGLKSKAKLITSIAVALAESGGRILARNRNRDGSEDRGLWQINSIHGALSTFDPQANARAMAKISKQGSNWSPWTVFKTKAHRRFIGAARDAVSKGITKGGADTEGTQDVRVPRRFGRSQTRAGLLDDAFSIGLEQGRQGFGLDVPDLIGQVREATTPATRKVEVPLLSAKGGKGKAVRGDGYPLSRKGKVIGTPRSGTHTLGNWESDNALDIRVPEGTRVLAVGAGKIGSVKGSYRGGKSRFDGFQVKLATRNNEIFYTHLRSASVRGGAQVGRGQVIGRSGSANGVPHLHMGVRQGSPYQYVGGKRRGGFVTPRSYGHGGRVRRFQTGGRIPRNLQTGVSQAGTFKGGSLENLGGIIDEAASIALGRLRRDVVRQVRKGGSAKTVQRLQSVIDLIDAELGHRVGLLERTIERNANTVERTRSGADRLLRAQGVDPSSSGGIALTQVAEQANLKVLQRNRELLGFALKQARRAGQGEKANEIKDSLVALNDEIAEQGVRLVELTRDRVRAAAQETVDRAGRGVELAQIGLAGFEVSQRANRTTDTPEGMRARAGLIQSQIVPALQAQMAALQAQAKRLASIGDRAGAEQVMVQIAQAGVDIASAMQDAADLVLEATKAAVQEVVDFASSVTETAQTLARGLEIQQRLTGTADTPGALRERAAQITGQLVPALTGQREALIQQATFLGGIGDINGQRNLWLQINGIANDIAEAWADSADLIRQAALEAAQDLVDAATHTSTIADLSLQRLELEQRLAGTFETGGQQRTDFIRNTIVPAIQGEIAALRVQRDEAARQNNADLVRQLDEQIFGKQNAILQANLDANEQTASNTDALKQFGGQLGFSFQSQSFTDLISLSVGA